MPKNAKQFFVPEVVQTSEMDCGPASLKALLEGFGIHTSYGRLREACQTSVDGTSIDTLEALAVQFGLNAQQIMLPADHVLIKEAMVLPALVVIRLSNGLTHFVVAWDQQSRWVQVMDPGTGRRWIPRQKFLDDLFIHQFPVPVQGWREWAASPDFLTPLRCRMSELKIPNASMAVWEAQALSDPGWRSLASLDAATRMTTAMLRAEAVKPGPEATRLLEQLFTDNRPGGRDDTAPTFPIPPAYWSVEPITGDSAEEQLLLRGALMVRVESRRLPETELTEDPASEESDQQPAETLSPELAAVLNEAPISIWKSLWQAVRQDSPWVLAILAAGLGITSVGITIQALLLQSLLRLGQILPAVDQRTGALIALFTFLIGIFLIGLPITATIQRLGRRLETRLRVEFLNKIPRLSDRYFHSRLTSDMAQRAHNLRSLRRLPVLGSGLLTTFFQLLLTTFGIIWLQPHSALFSLAATLVFIAVGWATSRLLEENDLRMRSHSGGLSRFYLDAMLGIAPLRTHSAERAFRREHENLLVEWVRAGLDMIRLNVLLQGLQAILYSGFATWAVFDYVSQGGPISGALLLFYWTLNLPTLGQTMVQQIQQIPMLRNSMLRVLEPLGAPDENDSASQPENAETAADQASNPEEPALTEPTGRSAQHGAAIEMRELAIQAGGHTILSGINLKIAPGDHLAIVGPSGAGKSTLVGVLLGWHKAAEGQLLVDGLPLTGERLPALRRFTAWVDPAIQIWNRTLLENLTYGNDPQAAPQRGVMLEDADLFGVFERLENGLQTVLGEGGGLVSGGEGQRVRLGRAMNRAHPRLIILDEPFRGLDREQRRTLLKRARQFWHDATLICITHDVGETQDFERVLVIENGQIAEDGAPAALAAQTDSRYGSMLQAEDTVRKGMWGSAPWRRLHIEDGHLTEENSSAQ
ncbi:MAG: cysteine peptidase family C39 domain-containing protein [Chloroflexi bacterium]|nr:cysteine peptidase family C39 domain-containing protein [Chloroflexota bacterium]